MLPLNKLVGKYYETWETTNKDNFFYKSKKIPGPRTARLIPTPFGRTYPAVWAEALNRDRSVNEQRERGLI